MRKLMLWIAKGIAALVGAEIVEAYECALCGFETEDIEHAKAHVRVVHGLECTDKNVQI